MDRNEQTGVTLGEALIPNLSIGQWYFANRGKTVIYEIMQEHIIRFGVEPTLGETLREMRRRSGGGNDEHNGINQAH